MGRLMMRDICELEPFSIPSMSYLSHPINLATKKSFGFDMF